MGLFVLAGQYQTLLEHTFIPYRQHSKKLWYTLKIHYGGFVCSIWKMNLFCVSSKYWTLSPSARAYEGRDARKDVTQTHQTWAAYNRMESIRYYRAYAETLPAICTGEKRKGAEIRCITHLPHSQKTARPRHEPWPRRFCYSSYAIPPRLQPVW